MAFLVMMVLIGCFMQGSQGLKIAAFNIQRFDQSKVNDLVIRNILIQILQRYDLITIEEIMEADNSAMTELVRELNRSTKLQYNYIISDHLGRSSYWEKYAFVYNENILKPMAWYHFDDGCEQCGTDTFIREPFIVHFHSLTTIVKDFVLVAIHTSPSYAVREVDALYDVWADARNHFNTENILILGDYNAACNYVTDSDWPHIRLRQHKNFHWLIDDAIDTTVSKYTHCAYDRFVVTTKGLLQAIVPGSVKAFNFQKAYDLPYYKKDFRQDFPATLAPCQKIPPKVNGPLHVPCSAHYDSHANSVDARYETGSSIGIEGGISGGPCSCQGVDFASCAGRCGAYSPNFPCSCTASCSKYNDCCADYKNYC